MGKKIITIVLIVIVVLNIPIISSKADAESIIDIIDDGESVIVSETLPDESNDPTNISYPVDFIESGEIPIEVGDVLGAYEEEILLDLEDCEAPDILNEQNIIKYRNNRNYYYEKLSLIISTVEVLIADLESTDIVTDLIRNDLEVLRGLFEEFNSTFLNFEKKVDEALNYVCSNNLTAYGLSLDEVNFYLEDAAAIISEFMAYTDEVLSRNIYEIKT